MSDPIPADLPDRIRHSFDMLDLASGEWISDPAMAEMGDDVARLQAALRTLVSAVLAEVKTGNLPAPLVTTWDAVAVAVDVLP